MKTEIEIKEAIERLKINKTKCKPFSHFGDDCHGAIDAQIETLEKGYDESEVYELWEDEDDQYIQSAAISILEWKDGDEPIDDYLYPEVL